MMNDGNAFGSHHDDEKGRHNADIGLAVPLFENEDGTNDHAELSSHHSRNHKKLEH